MSTHVATHVIFDMIHPRQEVKVAIDAAAQFQQDNIFRMTKVVWADGGWSWGKLWYFGGTNVVCRIGAGAYGDLTVWEHPVSPYDRAARRDAGLLEVA